MANSSQSQFITKMNRPFIIIAIMRAFARRAIKLRNEKSGAPAKRAGFFSMR
jgi:hypothetical protein